MPKLFAETSGGGSWMSHARGVAWLMQQRGPDSYLEDWDKSMLFSFRSMIVGHQTSALGPPLAPSQKRASNDAPLTVTPR